MVDELTAVVDHCSECLVELLEFFRCEVAKDLHHREVLERPPARQGSIAHAASKPPGIENAAVHPTPPVIATQATRWLGGGVPGRVHLRIRGIARSIAALLPESNERARSVSEITERNAFHD